MDASRWLVRFSGLLACAGLITGCDSSDDTSPPAGGDASEDGTADVSIVDATSSDASTNVDAAQSNSGADGGETGPSDACLAVDISAATVDAGKTWGCLESACSSQLAMCAGDCVCNDAMLSALLCAATGQELSTDCFTAEIAAHIGDPTVVVIGNCLLSNAALCTSEKDASTEDGGERPVDGGREGGSPDGGTKSDAASTIDAAIDASTDAVATDSGIDASKTGDGAAQIGDGASESDAGAADVGDDAAESDAGADAAE
jgi:hypothetical protein